MTRDQAVAWLNSQVGQYKDFDGQWQAQCTDLFNFYYQFLTGSNPYSDGYGVPGAKDLWDVPTDKFTRIPDSTSLVPQPGDVLIYGATWGGGFGHVEMVSRVDANGCEVVGNNLSGNPRLNVARGYRTWSQMNGLLGVMRFNGFNKGDELMNRDQVITTYQVIRGGDPSEAEIAGWIGKPHSLLVSAFRAEADATRQMNAQVIADLKALANKPPVEVVKEVEKIVTEYVDRPVEVIKEVNPSWLEAVISFIRSVLKIK